MCTTSADGRAQAARRSTSGSTFSNSVVTTAARQEPLEVLDRFGHLAARRALRRRRR
ncbi:MAG: hypothetical protein R2755_01365 [Acidimicrobiales bacterium]